MKGGVHISGLTERCPHCNEPVVNYKKDVIKNRGGGEEVVFLGVPASKCGCDEYSSLIDGVKLDLFLMKNQTLDSKTIRFENIQITNEEALSYFEKK